MLSFRAHSLEVRDRHYVLLPKLNMEQTKALGHCLASAGFSVSYGPSITARRPGLAIHIEQLGLCWASSDPSDYVYPSVPEILACRKEAVSLGRLISMYFGVFTRGRQTFVRLVPRLESLGNWDYLRSSGACGLAPDEQLLTRFLLSKYKGESEVITDFAVGDSSPFYSGRRLYFKSRLPASRASDTLRVVGSKAPCNSYLPRDGVLQLATFSPQRMGLAACFAEMGEWCPFIAAERESSNWRTEWPCSAPVV